MEKLNFGCGKDIKKGYVNVDITKFKGVDKVFDFNKFPYPFKANEFDEIYTDNVLEHLYDIPKVMKELHRIGKPNALVHIIVPYYNSYGAYNDVTHLHYFSHLAFEPFYKAGRSNYFIKEQFKLQKLTLVPTRFGLIIPSNTLRKYLSFILGQIIQTIDLKLIIKKV